MNRFILPVIFLLAALPARAQEKEKVDLQLVQQARELLEKEKYPEAEKAFIQLIALQTRVLGADDNDTLGSRGDLAIIFSRQKRLPEAEKEYRAILAARERHLRATDPAIFQTCHNLALNLAQQKRFAEALAFIQRAEQGWTGTLGPDHDFTKSAARFRALIEADVKKQQTK